MILNNSDSICRGKSGFPGAPVTGCFSGSIWLAQRMTRSVPHPLWVRNSAPFRFKSGCVSASNAGFPVTITSSWLRETYGNEVKAIGFSGHHLGVAVDVGACVLGAQWIERHYTLDRTWKGTDHAASLEPEGLRRVARDTTVVCEAMSYKNQEILEIEETQRKKLKETYFNY